MGIFGGGAVGWGMRKSIVAAIVLLLAGAGFSPARAEIVERELGTDAEGRSVRGYVFQADRSFRRSSRSSISSLRPRRVYRPGRGIVRHRGPVSSSYVPYWWVPVILLHCGGRSSVSIWHGSSASATFTLIR